MNKRSWLLAALAPATLTCSAGPPDTLSPDAPRAEAADLAITHVSVITMASDEVQRDRTVLIRNGRIAALAPSSELMPAAGTETIDGRGLYLLPGLIDMHVHIRTHELAAYLQYGVTTVRNMWGYNELPALMAQVDNGTRAGPRIFSLTAGFDGSPAQWPQTQLSDDVRTIPANLDHQVALGFREIKIYQRLSRAAYDTLVALAKRRGLTFAGHLPGAIALRYAIDAGQRSLEHLGGFVFSPQLTEDARYAASKGVYVCPTLQVQSMLNHGAGDAQRTVATRELHRQHVKILAGSDTGIDATQPGISLHQEMERLVEAGLSPYDALRGATTLAAEYLGQGANIGSIAVGREADLLLVRGNPLADIARTRDLVRVVVNGR